MKENLTTLIERESWKTYGSDDNSSVDKQTYIKGTSRGNKTRPTKFLKRDRNLKTPKSCYTDL